MTVSATSLVRFKARALVAATSLALAGGVIFWLSSSPISEASAAPSSSGVKPVAQIVTPMGGSGQNGSGGGVVTGLPDFASIVERQGPSVVNISAQGKASRGPQFDPNDPMFEFFRRFGGVPGFPGGPGQGGGRSMPAPRSAGSGFIVSADGVVLTNAHVVDEAAEVTVKLTDKREFKAKVVGIDKQTDVAVLKIDAKNLPAVTIGSAQQARVGEWVVAIGSPFGFENTVTAGIISAKSRSLPEEGYVPFLQTDVAINPGNSGGPLFNLKGEVIGINSQIYSRSGGYQGVSFAIPIDVAMKVQRQLLDNGKVQRGRLGVLIQEVDQALANSFKLDKPMGALISEVEEGGPADKSGLKAGDVILKFNGTEVARSGELPPLVADVTPGGKASVEIWRDGKVVAKTVTVGEVKGKGKRGTDDEVDPDDKLGLSVRPLTKQEQKQVGLGGGLLVEAVDGIAEKAGIRPGDVVLAVNGNGVNTAEQLRALVGKSGKRAALLIQREGRKLFVPVDLS
ncbi:MAG: DegQ family serine endoprotease [Rhodocyclaceae bacterium]|nr:DegQ family serine endoprotease [Rhodocyclaceae bacterium]